jgi:transcriptional regulator with XRE-family HTH domain
MATEPISIGPRLRALRTAAGLSQQALAVQAGLSVTVVFQLEQQRKHDVKLSTALALARVLGVTVEDLATAPAEAPAARRVGRPRKKGG